MLRRCTLLAVLLLTLSVIAPALLACEPGGDCCPAQGAPCGPEDGELAACLIEPSIAAAITASARQYSAELGSHDLQSPHGAAPAAARPSVQRPVTGAASVHSPQIIPDQQRLYLQTGRLRL